MFGFGKNTTKFNEIAAWIDTLKELRALMAHYGATNQDVARAKALTATIRSALSDVSASERAELQARFNA